MTPLDRNCDKKTLKLQPSSELYRWLLSKGKDNVLYLPVGLNLNTSLQSVSFT